MSENMVHEPSRVTADGPRLDELDLESFAADEATLSPGPWKLWTSCSYRRIGGASGCDGDVLHAYVQRGDGQPDLSMPEVQLFALVRLRNALPELLRYARLGVACEANGLAEFGATGEMLFQPPADVIAERAAEKTREAFAETLKDPRAVHLHMLRGFVARPSVREIIHLYGADALRAEMPYPTAEGRRENPENAGETA